MDDGSLTMTYSAIVTDKDQKKQVRVTFERKSDSTSVNVPVSKMSSINKTDRAIPGTRATSMTDRAEAILPDCKVTNQSGFTEEEIAQLELYLTMNKDDILSKAKVISNPLNWL